MNARTELAQCRTCGETVALAVPDEIARVSMLPCPQCEHKSVERIPYNSGYDEPHLLNIWVRATSLERAGSFKGGGVEAVETTLHELEAVGIDSADGLRDLAAAIELRLRELDTCLYQKMRDIPL